MAASRFSDALRTTGAAAWQMGRRPAVAGALGGPLGVLALLLWQAGAAFVDNANRWLPYPYPRPGSEGLMLYETLLMRQGGDLYGPITPDRFISGPYPPVYYWLAGQVMPDVPGFFDGRSLSMWAALAAAAAALLTVLVTTLATAPAPPRPGRGATLLIGLAAGLAAAGLWLAAPPVLIWATRFRADMLMMAFMAAGLACVALGSPPSAAAPPQSARALLVWAAIPLFVLALYTKQTALAGPAAAAAYLLVRDWRRGLAWVGGLLIVGGIPFLALDLASSHWFYLKMIVYHNLPWSRSTFTRLIDAWQQDHLLLILAALAYGLWLLWRRRNDLIAWYLLATLALLPTAGVVGADHNHLLAVDLALALAGGAGLAAAGTRLVAGWPGRAAWRPALALVAGTVACAGFLVMAAEPAGWYDPDLVTPSAAQQTQLHKIVEMVRQSPPGSYLADDPGLLALAGKSTPYDDLFTITALAADRRWDAGALEAQLQRGAFPLILLAGDVADHAGVPLRSDILTDPMRGALQHGYRILYRDIYFTYVPK
jgi:hypothetical protein